MDYRTGYFRQAQADYLEFQRIGERDNVPFCYRLHYLQMATEKLAKGFLTKPGKNPYKRSHHVFVKFIQTGSLYDEIREELTVGSNSAWSAYLRSLLPLAKQIQELSPDGEDHPNPEYPWQDGK